MRYVRANDETARAAIEQMTEGLPPAWRAPDVQAMTSSLRIVPGG